MHQAVREIGDLAGFLVDGEREAVAAHLHAVEHAVDFDRREQLLKHLRADGNLHQAVRHALLVGGGDADVLAHGAVLVLASLLHQRTGALQQLAKCVGLALRVVAERERGGRVGGGGAHAVDVEYVDDIDLEHLGELKQAGAVFQLGILIDDIGCDLRLAQVACVAFLAQRLGALAGIRRRLRNRVGAVGVDQRLVRQREERLHIERHDDHRHQAHDGQHRRLGADLLGIQHRAERGVILLDVPLALVVAQHENAIQHHGRHHHAECEQHHAHGDVARGGERLLQHRGNVIRCADFGDPAIQARAVERHMEEVPVLQVVDA